MTSKNAWAPCKIEKTFFFWQSNVYIEDINREVEKLSVADSGDSEEEEIIENVTLRPSRAPSDEAFQTLTIYANINDVSDLFADNLHKLKFGY